MTKQRNSNIELLRILAMAFIVAGHFSGQAGVVDYRFCVNDFLLVFFSSGARIAVNIFLFIGVWYMVDSQFHASRVLKIYGQVVFFSIPLTLLTLMLRGQDISLKDTMRGLMPFLGRGLWFASAYITLLLFSPFLNQVLSWKKRKLQTLLILLLLFVPGICTLPDLQDSYVLDSVWFLIAYLTVGYVKRYPLKFQYSNILNFVAGGLSTYCS